MIGSETKTRSFSRSDEAVARWLAEREPASGDVLRTAVLALTLARREGHTALPLDDAMADFADVLADYDIAIPDIKAFRADLEGSRLVGSPGDLAPLILDGNLLSLRRFHEGERAIASEVLRRVCETSDATVDDSLKEPFARLFADETGEVDWQAVAEAAALRTRLLCIAGGPGTGKTTTVTRLIAILLSREPDLRIALAAPTGKAANRMAESIRDQVARLAMPDDETSRIPSSASTLHRLLGYNPSRARFSYGKNRKLGADVVIVDEASMIDHEMFSALLDALDDDARLILLGDPDQLPSVEAGVVFGTLCRQVSGEEKSAEFVRDMETLGVHPKPRATSTPHPLQDSVITLTRGHRFGPDSGIGLLAYAIRDGKQDDIRQILESGSFADIEVASHDDQKRIIRTTVRDLARQLVNASSADDALAVLDSVRVLSPVRIGDRGVEALNDDLEAYLVQEGVRPPARDYRGKPILVTSNDYEVSLFNGDVGILWESQDGRLEGCFPAADGTRRVPLNRLPAHEVAWAMTIHKSQGSEFDHVVIVLPDRDEAGRLTRELLYTAGTRARKKVTIIGDVEVMVEASNRRERRSTGLPRMLETGDFDRS
jgi:exodeoxyribonuclease V alpha subunit